MKIGTPQIGSQRARSSRGRGAASGGFTLAEAAITILIVGLTITYTLQALTSAQSTAAHTAELKLAREMALRTLGEVQTGRYQAEMNDVITGSYPEDVAPYMSYEIAFGDAELPERRTDDDRRRVGIDNWANRRQWENDTGRNDDEEETEEDYEIVRIRVTFARHSKELDDYFELEAWIPWDQVYGVDEDELLEDEESSDDTTGDDTSGDGAAGGNDTNSNRGDER